MNVTGLGVKCYLESVGRVAARVEGEPCCALLGGAGAGHFVKMLHNGIEYAVMQLIAETYWLMGQALGLRPHEMAAHFARWNRGELASYLVGITARVLRAEDPATGEFDRARFIWAVGGGGRILRGPEVRPGDDGSNDEIVLEN